MNFSEFYDIFQEDVDYDALLAPILPYLKMDQQILDAGCGSGHILSHLLSKGYDVIGIDNDETMLELAQKNITFKGYTPKLFFHDLRKPLNHKFHQIISLLDVFHFFKGVKTLVRNLYNALYDGGRLILDLYKAPINMKESDTVLDLSYTWDLKTVNHTINHHIQVYTNTQLYTYNVKQYYYALDYYLDILRKVGFEVTTFDGFDDRKLYILCTK